MWKTIAPVSNRVKWPSSLVASIGKLIPAESSFASVRDVRLQSARIAMSSLEALRREGRAKGDSRARTRPRRWSTRVTGHPAVTAVQGEAASHRFPNSRPWARERSPEYADDMMKCRDIFRFSRTIRREGESRSKFNSFRKLGPLDRPEGSWAKVRDH
jgi:hypothetical protein